MSKSNRFVAQSKQTSIPGRTEQQDFEEVARQRVRFAAPLRVRYADGDKVWVPGLPNQASAASMNVMTIQAILFAFTGPPVATKAATPT